jgi:hypothetical protein
MKLCHDGENHYAECRNLFIGMLNVVLLSVIMLSIVRPNDVKLSVELIPSAHLTNTSFFAF